MKKTSYKLRWSDGKRASSPFTVCKSSEIMESIWAVEGDDLLKKPLYLQVEINDEWYIVRKGNFFPALPWYEEHLKEAIDLIGDSYDRDSAMMEGIRELLGDLESDVSDGLTVMECFGSEGTLKACKRCRLKVKCREWQEKG